MIYLDSAATTDPFDSVLEEELLINKSYFANASSIHNFGFQSKKVYEKAKTNILKLLHLERSFDLVFTSGASESNNLVLREITKHFKNRGKTILVSAIEHPSVLLTAKSLEKDGFNVVEIPVDENGLIDLDKFKSLLNNDVILVSIMTVNNEIGVIQNFTELSNEIRKYPKILFHTDATQSLGKEIIDYSIFDFISFSAHKFHSTKGTGGLIFNKKISFTPFVIGGSQQNNLRAGTLDIASYAGAALALELTTAKLKENYKHICDLRDFLIEQISLIDEISLNSNSFCTPYIVNFSLKKHKASVIVEGLSEREIYVSSVSACSSKKENVSYVILAMGKSLQEASNTIRVSFSETNTIDELKIFIENLKVLLSEVRPL